MLRPEQRQGVRQRRKQWFRNEVDAPVSRPTLPPIKSVTLWPALQLVLKIAPGHKATCSVPTANLV